MTYENLFNFYGYPLKVRSNTQEPLDHISFLYRRFLVSRDPEKENPIAFPKQDGKLQIEIQDHLKDANRMTVSYGQWSNQISITDDGYHVICRDSQNGYYKTVVFPSLFSFFQSVMISAIGSQIQKSHIFIHASAVSWKRQGVIFPAQPNSGKSTLSVYLLRQGFKFLSDEIACYNLVRQRLEAHPRSVRIRESSDTLLDLNLGSSNFIEDKATGKWIMDIEDIIPDCMGDPCPLNFIFFLNGFAEKPRLKPIEQFTGLRKLLTSCFNPKEDGAYSFTWIAPMLRESKCFELTMGPLDETAEVLIKTCEKGRTDESA